MVKKEQIQKELEMLKQDNKALQQQISELTAENEELKKELEAAKNADARTETEKTEKTEKTEIAGTEAAARDPEVNELKGKIGILLGAIAASCKDHCPHHLNAQACRNCNIRKSVFNAGFNMPEVIE